MSAAGRDDDWDDYRFVLALHRAGSLAAAGRDLGVDGTTVARRLSQVEARLGARLFDRERGRTVATAAALGVLERLARVDDELGRVRDALSGADRRVEGEVAITAVPMIFRHALVPRLHELLAAHPALAVEAIVDPALLGIAARREADIAIRGVRPETDPDAVTRKLGDMSYGLYCRRDLVEAGTEPEWLAYAHRGFGQPQSGWIEARMAAGGASSRMSGNDTETLLRCVLAGLGKSLLPDALARDRPELVRLDAEDVPSRELWLLMHPSGRRVRRIEVVAEWVTETVRAFLAPR